MISGKVSIIIPCYNDGNYINRAIQSAIDQTYVNKEIIVIDDGSDLKTKEILARHEKNISLLITQDNEGVCSARNNAIAASDGEFILTLDADDFFEPSFASKAVKIMESNNNVGAVTCYANLFNTSGVYHVQKPKEVTLESLIYSNNAYACMLFRRLCWERVGGYDMKLTNGFEDWEFNIAIEKDGWDFKVIPQPLFNYRNKEGSRNKNISIEDNIKLVKYIYIKHKDLYMKNYEGMVDFLFYKLKDARNKENKIANSPQYKIGKYLCSPFLWIKRKIKFQ